MSKFRLKECRLKHGYSQEQLAAKLNVARPTYTRYETGSRGLPVEMLMKLADIYGCTTDEILGSRYYYEVIAIEERNSDD